MVCLNMFKHIWIYQEGKMRMLAMAMVVAGCNSTGGVGEPLHDAGPADLVSATDQGTALDQSIAQPDLANVEDLSVAPDQAIAPDLTQARDMNGAPTCTLTVMPNVGTTQTMFTFTLTSANANSCTATFDGMNLGAQACSGMQTFGNFPVGMHKLTITATGPNGMTMCSCTFTVM